ncbi:uncharacterized protein F5147DRAFT_649664 [Suillus discolor]|uniref:Uncharacterized protein n=1 Tax=Suillus discolor TaxID=1912936 RepID=A0A9P7FDR5_9AGAM|nr:uncharacterized protein F5147DRAFT_649664 [Suillus discolor]KAG2115282.1 hypothetical protein F5147DRAFT_649664 [Suillus discolor]
MSKKRVILLSLASREMTLDVPVVIERFQYIIPCLIYVEKRHQHTCSLELCRSCDITKISVTAVGDPLSVLKNCSDLKKREQSLIGQQKLQCLCNKPSSHNCFSLDSHSLSYTTFSYSNLTLSKAAVLNSEFSLNATITIRNMDKLLKTSAVSSMNSTKDLELQHTWLHVSVPPSCVSLSPLLDLAQVLKSATTTVPIVSLALSDQYAGPASSSF